MKCQWVIACMYVHNVVGVLQYLRLKVYVKQIKNGFPHRGG